MRHRSASRSFSRHPSHRRAMLRNLVLNLLQHDRIRTTLPKAKAARPLAEKLITLGKKGTVHHRQLASRALGSTVAAKGAVRRLFGELKDRFANRNGGYTRILHLPRTIRQAKVDLPRSPGVVRSKLYGTRLCDNAEMVLWELCEAEIRKPERRARRVRSKKPRAKRKEEAQAQAAPARPAEPPAAEPQPPQAPQSPAGEPQPAQPPAAEPQATQQPAAEQQPAQPPAPAPQAAPDQAAQPSAPEQQPAQQKPTAPPQPVPEAPAQSTPAQQQTSAPPVPPAEAQ